MSNNGSTSWDGYSLKKKRDVPEGLWRRCPGCEDMIFARTVEENFGVCPECQHHFRIGAHQRIGQLCDQDSFEEQMANCFPVDALKFTDSQGYKQRLLNLQKKTGLADAVVMGKGFVKGRPLILVALDPNFMMGSMGSVVGEKIATAAELATELQLPLVIISCSGGARMQEGVLSLMQMAKTSGLLAVLAENRIPFISVLTHPTTGGVMASFAALGDVIIAEPKALLGFAGPRVIKQTIGQDLPEGFQSSEFQLAKGFVDRVVNRKDLRPAIISLLGFMWRN